MDANSSRTGMATHLGGVPANYWHNSIQLKQDHSIPAEQVSSQLLTEISANYPVLFIEFGQRVADLLGDLMSTAQPIEVKFFGDDYKKLEEISLSAEKNNHQNP